MKTLLPLLFLAALAGAQDRPSLVFGGPDTNRGCYQASVREGWKCSTGIRPQLWMLMPLVEPLPPPTFTFTNSASATWVVMCDKDSKNCKLGQGYTLDDVIAIYQRDCIKFGGTH